MDLSRFHKAGDDASVSFGKASYAFDATSEDDVTIGEGDYVAVLKKDQDGWARVVINGQAGFVPANYIAPVSPQEYHTATGAGGGAADPGAAYEAIADYRAGDAGQVSLSVGDTVAVLEKSNADWWMVRAGGAEGFAPASYLQPSTKRAPPAAPPPARGLGGGGGGGANAAAESFGTSMAINFSGGMAVAPSRSSSVRKPMAPRAPGGIAKAPPKAPGAPAGGSDDAPLAFISPTERRRREEEEHRRTMRRANAGGATGESRGGGAAGNRDSMTTAQLVEEANKGNEKLRRQLQLAESALESTNTACSELSRQISRLSQTRSLEQCRAEHEELVAVVSALKAAQGGGLRLASLAQRS